MGRMTKDADIKYTNGDKPMCIARYTLAVDRRYKTSNQNADFIPCVAFGKNGEFIEKYCHKGTKLAIVGHITTSSYTNRDGQRVYTTEVTIDEQEFAESKAAQAQNNQASQPQTQNTQSQTSQPQDDVPTVNNYDDFMNNIPDGLDSAMPFA